MEVEIFSFSMYTKDRIIEKYYLEHVLLGAGLVLSLGISHMASTLYIKDHSNIDSIILNKHRTLLCDFYLGLFLKVGYTWYI